MPPRPVIGEIQYGAPLYSAHRSDIHSALREAAISKDGLGLPAELRLSSRVASYDADTGLVTLEDGMTDTADLIVAADGVHSEAATCINGFDCPAQGTESTVVRFMIPTRVLLDDPLTAPLLARGSGQFTSYISNDGQKLLAQYDCRGSKLQNFGMYVPKPIAEGENDHKKTVSSNRTALKEAMEGFHPSLQRLCDKTEEVLPLWRVTERAPVPRCTKGKLVMVGDAAHPMRPSQGQGFAQGVQDAAVLQVLFEDLRTGDKQLIMNRLKVFQSIRQARVAAVQLYSSKKIMDNPGKLMEAEVRKWLGPDMKLPQNQLEMNDWMMQYNAAEDARRVLAQSKR